MRASLRRAGRDHAAALLGFASLTVALTFPITFRAGTTLRDPGDPLFNTWILAWNAHSLVHGRLRGFFDANIFFPTPNTLAYSEFLIPQTLLAAPIVWLSGNPVLAYNGVLLAAFFTTAVATYLLGAHLNGRLAGFVAGLIFAFSPFMMSHLSHLQVLSAAGIPLVFLFLDRFLTDGRTRDLVLFSTSYVLQTLANAYYAMYLALFGGIYILVHVVQRRRYLDRRLWAHLTLHVAIVAVTIGPFFSRYLTLRQDLGFVRRPANPATGFSFLATPPFNWLYGDATGGFMIPESALFPGGCALLLAGVGLVAGLGLRGARGHRGPRWIVPLYRAVGWAVAGWAGVIVSIAATGGFEVEPLGIPIRATSYQNPVLILVSLIAARLTLRWAFRVTPARRPADPRLLYGLLAAIAFVLTLPGGPYRLLYGLPGFDGLRAATRVHVITMLGVAVLASYGIGVLRTRLRGSTGRLVAGGLAGAIVLEYLSVPVPFAEVPVTREIPAVHRWMATRGDDFAIAEYPIVRPLLLWQQYFSAYHWKRLVTGASGYPSPTYLELLNRNEAVPSPATLDDFADMGVRYLVVHDRPGAMVSTGQLDAAIARLGDRVRLVDTLDSYDLQREPAVEIVTAGTARIYELTRSDWASPELVRDVPERAGATLVPSDRTAWRLAAQPHPELAGLAVDGNLRTRWHSEPQRPGDFFQVDLGQPTRVDGILLDHSLYRRDYPRGYRIDVSLDGVAWSTVSEAPEFLPPLTQFLRPRSLRLDLPFSPTRTRYLRIVQTGSDDVYWWSITEINVTGDE